MAFSRIFRTGHANDRLLIENAALEAEITALKQEQGCSSDDDGKARRTHMDAAGRRPDPLKPVDTWETCRMPSR